MIQPITLIQVGQMMWEDYGLDPADAFTEARKLMDRLEARGLQVIRGEWVMPEVIVVDSHEPVKPKPPADVWAAMAQRAHDEILEREPWQNPELK